MATSPLVVVGLGCGRNGSIPPHCLGGPQSMERILECYITLAIATSKEGRKLRWIHNPCRLGGPEAGKKS